MSRKKRKPEAEDRDAGEDTPRPDEEAREQSPEGIEAGAEVDATAGGEPVDEVDRLRAERDELIGRLQRVSADYQNYRKRVQKDIAHAREYANEELIKAMLGVLDDMERALAAAREHGQEDDPLLEGMQIVHDNALATLGRFGVERIEAVGQPFDPEQHQAVMQQAADEPPMTVLQEVQTGYRLKGRPIRASSVIVSTGPGEEADGEADDNTGPEAPDVE